MIRAANADLLKRHYDQVRTTAAVAKSGDYRLQQYLEFGETQQQSGEEASGADDSISELSTSLEENDQQPPQLIVVLEYEWTNSRQDTQTSTPILILWRQRQETEAAGIFDHIAEKVVRMKTR